LQERNQKEKYKKNFLRGGDDSRASHEKTFAFYCIIFILSKGREATGKEQKEKGKRR